MSLLPVADALARVTAGLGPLGPETVALTAAEGRVLAADVAATRTQPPFAASAMDGYALRGADVAVGRALDVVGEVPAGAHFPRPLLPGEAVRIFTGAPLPEGADTVLIQENAARDGDRVTPTEPVATGRNVRPAGLDFRAGEVLLRAGTRLGYRELSLAAAMNHANLPVVRRPRVVVLATGDELVAPGETPGPNQIVTSNSFGIAALARDNGAEVIDLGIAPDRADLIAARVVEAIRLGADVLVTLGGASVGDHDLVKPALGKEGMDLGFWKIAMRPGKPLAFGRLGATRVFGLPGNPVASLVCGLIFLEPALRLLAGLPPRERETDAVLGAPLAENDLRHDYLRARLDRDAAGRLVATAFPVQDSSMLRVFADAEALILRPPFAPAAPAGAPCRIVRLD